MTQTDTSSFDELLGGFEWVLDAKPFQVLPDEKAFKTIFSVQTKKGKIPFTISIPFGYPNGSIVLCSELIKGYDHQNFDSTICINPPPITSALIKFKFEIEKLRAWLVKYFENEEKPSHFDYLFFERSADVCLIFDEPSENRHLKKTFGHFHYSLLNEISIKENQQLITFYAKDIGEFSARWSTIYRKQNDIRQGIWIFLDAPPVIERRITYINWNDLLGAMSIEQIQFLYEYKNYCRRLHGLYSKFLIGIGYKIPNFEFCIEEIHWEIIEDSVTEIPSESTPFETSNYRNIKRPQKINWGYTQNSSIERFFGRGRLADSITNKRVLIIGTGAVGSALANILVRGGLLRLDLMDHDVIEAGNICRSTYMFVGINKLKVLELQLTLRAASPFAEIETLPALKNVRIDQPEFYQQAEILHKYDLIIDSSTDKYLSIMLDAMPLTATILNISISNRARELVMVTGNGNIHLKKADIFDSLNNDAQRDSFFPGTGCYSPTFIASYADINALVSCSVVEINARAEKGLPLESFIILSRNSTTGKMYELSYEI